MDDLENKDMELLIMNLIVDAGNARSYAMEAIHLAKEGKLDSAKAALDNANLAISKAHHVQTDLIQQAAQGKKVEVNLFMVHAQDHIMTAMLAKELAGEIVEVYKKLG